MCPGESVTNNSYSTIVISVSVSLMMLIIVTNIVVLTALFWLRRKREPALMDNIAYHSHNIEKKNDVITSRHSISENVIAATNPAYVATSVPTSPNPAYQLVAPPKSMDSTTAANVAYAATSIGTSVNPTYQPMQSRSDNTREYALYRPVTDNEEDYDYPRQE